MNCLHVRELFVSKFVVSRPSLHFSCSQVTLTCEVLLLSANDAMIRILMVSQYNDDTQLY